MTPLVQFEKDPDAILDFSIDWSEIFPGDALASAAMTVPDGLTLENETSTETLHIFRLSGGTAGQRYRLISEVTTSSGQKDQRTVEVLIVQK